LVGDHPETIPFEFGQIPISSSREDVVWTFSYIIQCKIVKSQGLVVSDKKMFENCVLKTYFVTPWPTYATKWNGLSNLGIPVKFGQNPINGFRGEYVYVKNLTDDARRRTKAGHNSSPWKPVFTLKQLSSSCSKIFKKMKK